MHEGRPYYPTNFPMIQSIAEAVSPARKRVLIVASPIWEESAAKILKGVAQYQRGENPWDTYWDNEGLSLEDPSWFESGRWDGVISRHTNELQVRSCANAGIPLVDVNNAQPFADVPNVALDNTAVGRLGGEHFIDRGLRHFAFCGFANLPWSCERCAGFRDALVTIGLSSAIFETVYPNYYAQEVTPGWHSAEIAAIAAWLVSLPKPVGVMACNDFRALDVLRAARDAGLRVPEEVAVLGANNDEARCELAIPPLSSVVTNHLRSGYLAAEALDRLMHGRPLEGLDLCVDPVEVITRHSTDVLAVDDRRVSAAARFIQQNACRGVTVDEVCRHAGIARTQLEEKFRRHFARSPQAEIRRVQLGKIKQLLQDTDLTLNAIADLTGFAHPEYMIVFFKRATGESPGRYRRKLRF